MFASAAFVSALLVGLARWMRRPSIRFWTLWPELKSSPPPGLNSLMHGALLSDPVECRIVTRSRSTVSELQGKMTTLLCDDLFDLDRDAASPKTADLFGTGSLIKYQCERKKRKEREKKNPRCFPSCKWPTQLLRVD